MYCYLIEKLVHSQLIFISYDLGHVLLLFSIIIYISFMKDILFDKFLL